MYYRIIVKQNGNFLFRTSKIKTATQVAIIKAAMLVGFSDQELMPNTTLEVLQVKGEPVGEIVTDEQLGVEVEVEANE